jgi:hypothetical protein
VSEHAGAPRPKRLDERVAPSWADLCTNLLRGGGFVVGAFLVYLGFVTGGFFLALTGVLGAIAIIGGWWLGGLIQRESWYESSNARAKSYALAAGFPIALIVFAQVAGPFLTPAPTTVACFAGAPPRDGGLHTDLAVDPRIKSMEFTVVVNQLGGGAVRWFINDPIGDAKWGDRAEEAGTYTSGPLPASGGIWKVNLISEADQLDYRIEWRSLDPVASGAPAC